MNKTLEELRKEIDSIDNEIMNCILKRFEIVKWIKEYKEKNIKKTIKWILLI